MLSTIVTRIGMLALVFAVSVAGVAPALAQDNDEPYLKTTNRMELYLAGIEIVAEALEMDPVAVVRTLAVEETSLSQLIAIAGADPAAIITALGEAIGLSAEGAQTFLDTEYPLTGPEMVFGDMGLPLPDAEAQMMEPITRLIWAIALRTDLSVDDIRARMEAGETLAEIAESAGLDTDALMDEIMERLAAMDERLAVGAGIRAAEAPGEVGTMIRVVFTSDNDALRERFRRGGVVNLIVVGAIAEELGLSRLEVRAGLEAGETFAEFIERNGGSVTKVQEAATQQLIVELEAFAEVGLLTEKDADLMIKSADFAVEDMLRRILRHSPADPFGIMDED